MRNSRDLFGRPNVFPRDLLVFGLGHEDNGIGRDRPIGSGIKDESWGRGGVKDKDNEKYYDDGGEISSLQRFF